MRYWIYLALLIFETLDGHNLTNSHTTEISQTKLLSNMSWTGVGATIWYSHRYYSLRETDVSNKLFELHSNLHEEGLDNRNNNTCTAGVAAFQLSVGAEVATVWIKLLG